MPDMFIKHDGVSYYHPDAVEKERKHERRVMGEQVALRIVDDLDNMRAAITQVYEADTRKFMVACLEDMIKRMNQDGIPVKLTKREL